MRPPPKNKWKQVGLWTYDDETGEFTDAKDFGGG